MSWLLRDWPFKLLAVVIAAMLWAVVVTRDRAVVAAVPVEYVGLDRELVLAEMPRETVDVEAGIARWALSRFRPDTLRARVDMQRLAEGEHVVTLSAEDVQAPPGVRVRRVTPGRLRLRLAGVAEVTLHVVPVVRGTPAPGHRVSGVRVHPIAVQVKGPRSTIEARDTVQTAPVDVTGHRSRVTRSVELSLPDAVWAVNEGKVQVTVNIQAVRSAALRTEESAK